MNILKRLFPRLRISNALEEELVEIPIVVKTMFLRGDIDAPGIAFGGAIYDLHNPPWKEPDGDKENPVPIVGVPYATFKHSVPWEHIFAQRIF